MTEYVVDLVAEINKIVVNNYIINNFERIRALNGKYYIINNIIKYYENKNVIDLKVKYISPVSLYILCENNSVYMIDTWSLYKYKDAYKSDTNYNYIDLDDAFHTLYLLRPDEPSCSDIYHGLSRLGGNHYIIKSIREYNGRNYALLQKTMSREDADLECKIGMNITLKLLLRKLDNNQKVEQIWKWTDTFSKKDPPAVLISEKIIDSGNGNTIKCASKY